MIKARWNKPPNTIKVSIDAVFGKSPRTNVRDFFFFLDSHDPHPRVIEMVVRQFAHGTQKFNFLAYLSDFDVHL